MAHCLIIFYAVDSMVALITSDPVPINTRKNSQEFLRKGAIVRITNKIILIILLKFERIATPVPSQKKPSELC